jgi:hypothetical protein
VSTPVNQKRAERRTTPATQNAVGGTETAGFEPPYPGVVAAGFFSLWIAMLSLPMLRGAFLATPVNDQYSSGYAYREWAVQWWKELGHIPLWNPEIFGGMPFVAGMHGDIFYPTAWLRLLLPIHVAMNLGFVIHYVLAGVFTYWFLRKWNVSWTGAVVGGLTYQLSGVIGSYVSPGHDGKLFVTALLPLMLVSLTLAVRDRRWEGYALLALAVGLALLSPHPQMAQYALIAAGIFTLYLAFGEPSDKRSWRDRLMPLGLALAAVIVGVGIGAIQYLPFYAYIPFSPRDASAVQGFEWSARFAIPWIHVPEFLIPRFAGESFNSSYWGSNGIKLHSEYLGLAAIGLAVLGVLNKQRRRLIYWLGGTALLFLLVGLGSATPFYRLWWEIVPFAEAMRAPGMALFCVSLVVAIFAAFGVDHLISDPKNAFPIALTVTGIAVALLGAAGVFSAMADALAQGVEMDTGIQGATQASGQAADGIRWGAVGAGLALGFVGLIGMALERGAIKAPAAALALVVVIGTDVWLNARVFWNYSRAHEELFADDEVKRYLRAQDRPLRVWDFENPQGVPAVYPGAALMADDIAQLYGHHGNELHAFDELHGRLGASLMFQNAGHPQLLNVHAINHIIVHSQVAPDSLPGFTKALDQVSTSSGATATLFEREEAIPYARFIPSATKAGFEETVATVLDQRFPIDRVALLDSASAVQPDEIPESLPEPSDLHLTVEDWRPGAMSVRIPGGAPARGFVLISENHYKDWRATVDGSAVPVIRTDAALMSIPVDPGAQGIHLEFVSPEYALGKTVTLASLVFVLAGFVTPIVIRRKGGG